MLYNSEESRNCYFPALLSNGEISFAVDAEGMIGYTMEEYSQKGVRAFDGIVVRSARRTAMCNAVRARLFPFGKFTFSEGSKLQKWSQNLLTHKGFFESDCRYESGTVIHSQGFIHPEYNIYALQKTFESVEGKKEFTYEVELCGYNESVSQYMQVLYAKKQGDICCIGFKMYGMDVFTGEIRFFVDKDFTVTPTDNGAKITFEASANDVVTFYYYLEDDMGNVDFNAVLKEYKEKIDEAKFSGLLAECVAHFESFYNLGYVDTADEELSNIYKTSLYSVKSNTTKYSVAVGFNNGSWDGKYFPFDEYTSYCGLMGANRLELAKRIPEYRKNACLPVAISRGSDCHPKEDTEEIAWFHWETGEADNFELAAEGNWLDHVFHIPLIGLSAYEYYEYSQDVQYLEEVYPMIRACAMFMTKKMVYRDGKRTYIGKCTDLERLGSAVENPFMTACGAIQLLRCCYKAAEVLGIDEAYAKECKDTAEELLANLPKENGMYVPFLNCKQKSIAVFAGKFPFNVLEDCDTEMLAAWDDFEKNGRAYGNMYPVGNNISPWYACWKALGYARAKLADKAYESLKQAYCSAGVFGELFEINESEVCLRPWFATAAGIFVSAVNNMLLQSEGDTIYILPAFPHSVDVSFKLAAKGGVLVEASVKNGVLEKAVVLKKGADVTKDFKVKF